MRRAEIAREIERVIAERREIVELRHTLTLECS